MRVIVESLYTEQQDVIEGTASQVEDKLVERYPWLASYDHEHAGDIEGLVDQLNSAQAYNAWIDSEDLSKSAGNLRNADLDGVSEVAIDMLGFSPQVHSAFAAAQFLSGKPEVSLQTIRQALYEHEDYIDAAVHAYGLPEGDKSRRAIRAVMGMSELGERAIREGPKVPAGEHIEPGTPDATTTVEALRRAWSVGAVRAVWLPGKYSNGALIAHDSQEDRVYLLKPGFSGQSSAAGAAQEHAGQPRREVAFWQIAEDWGLGENVSRCDLVIIDAAEYAAIEMLPFTWRGCDSKDPDIIRRALSSYRDRGLLHKWAVIDFVLGNPDRHADNMMISGDNKRIALIDHGSAFAGSDFDPAYDRKSFVPYYLRVWVSQKFNRLTVKEKLERMPTVGGQLRDDLREWLNHIHADRLEAVLYRFGIDPHPTLDRLAKVKMMAGSKPVDLAIMTLWVTT